MCKNSAPQFPSLGNGLEEAFLEGQNGEFSELPQRRAPPQSRSQPSGRECRRTAYGTSSCLRFQLEKCPWAGDSPFAGLIWKAVGYKPYFSGLLGGVNEIRFVNPLVSLGVGAKRWLYQAPERPLHTVCSLPSFSAVCRRGFWVWRGVGRPRLEMQGIGWRDGVRSTDLDLNAPQPRAEELSSSALLSPRVSGLCSRLQAWKQIPEGLIAEEYMAGGCHQAGREPGLGGVGAGSCIPKVGASSNTGKGLRVPPPPWKSDQCHREE